MTTTIPQDSLAASRWDRLRSIEPYAVLVVLWAFLLSPVLLVPILARDQYPLDDLYVFNLLSSLLWCGLLISLFARPVLFHLFALPLYVTTAIDLFLLNNFGTRLSSSYIGVIISDISETSDFISTYFLELLPLALCLVVVYPYLLSRVWAIRLSGIRVGRAVACSLLLVALYTAAAARSIQNGGELVQSINAVVAKETSAPIGALAQSYSALKQSAESADLVRARRDSTAKATKESFGGTEVYVWVVGESSRPQSWGLYGYTRDTTPLLREQAGLVVLQDVLTTAPLTAIAVPSMLSLKPVSQWESVLREKSIIGAFREVGFQTMWLSTQEADGWAGIIPQIANEADQTRFFDHAHDGAILDSVRRVVNEARDGEKLFLLIHTKGSHFEYSRRYPPEFSVFGAEEPTLKDAYDNSIRYTDWIISSIINILSSKSVRSALIYASDHGENLRDDSMNLLGHSIGNEFDLRVPAVIWFSEQFIDAHQHELCIVGLNRNKALSISDLPHSFLDMVGIQSPLIDRTRSIFRREFTHHPRNYILSGKLHKYDEPGAVESISIREVCR